MTRLLALTAALAACLILSTAASADVADSRVAQWRLGEQPVFDDFGTLDAWTFDSGSGTLSASGGQLVPSTTGEKRLHLTGSSYADAQGTLALTTGSTTPSSGNGVVLRRRDSSNFLLGTLNPSGGLGIWKVDNGSFSALQLQTRAALSTGTQYWVRFSAAGNALTLKVYSADPAGGAAALTTTTHTLSGADATKFGAGVAAPAGIRLDLVPTDYRYSDFKLEPLRAADSAGSNHGTYTGGFTLGQSGATSDGDKAVKLDGSTGYVTAPDANALDLGDSLSVEAWFKRNATGDQTLVGKGQNAYVLSITDGKLTLRKGGDGNIVQSTTTPGADGNWHHVVATKNGSNAKIYLDGADVSGSVTNPPTLLDSADALNIGTNLAGDSGKWNGWVDDVALYTRALSAAEVGRLFKVTTRCTQTLSPGANIPTAVQNAAAGGAVCLNAGTYNTEPTISSTNGTESAPVTLTSANSDNPATINGRLVTGGTAKWLRVSHLKFTWSSTEQDTIALSGDHITLEHNDISGSNDTICIVTTGWQGVDATNIEIDHNKIHDCGDVNDPNPDINAGDRSHAQGVYTSTDSSHIEVTNNWCWDVAARCYQERAGTNDLWSHNVADYDNWGYHFGDLNPHDNIMEWNISGTHEHHYTTNSQLFYYGGDFSANGGTGVNQKFRNNCWQGEAYPSPMVSNVTVENNVIGYPQFVDPANGDFRLRKGSDCEGYGPTGALPGP
ncbi:MAG TPA: LamG-like jellyroll fold domain-containing protein [Thermoleophilaceae bacterium]